MGSEHPAPASGDPPDRRVVEVQIGRPPRSPIEVAVRCRFGLPLVVRTPPRLDDGTPFPTRYWLTCPIAVRNAGRLESAGAMAGLNERLRDDPELAAAYRRAHERYRIDRDGGLDGKDESAGGMPVRVKCLHALYAHEVADSNPIGALVRADIDPVDCPGRCVTPAGEPAARHPGFARR